MLLLDYNPIQSHAGKFCLISGCGIDIKWTIFRADKITLIREWIIERVMPSSHLNLWSEDQNLKCRSADLPSLALSNRAMARIHIKNMLSWELFCFASVDHRPFIARQSGDHRPMIGQPVTDKYIYVHAYNINM